MFVIAQTETRLQNIVDIFKLVGLISMSESRFRDKGGASGVGGS
jgi:hypothetical protein